jgi:hypothetical protein
LLKLSSGPFSLGNKHFGLELPFFFHRSLWHGMGTEEGRRKNSEIERKFLVGQGFTMKNHS